ncbi:hypothetical protein AcW1_000434 [Taiwanofungus camphoratus]|nr:hypothetical protein AcW1_000434 [Antrodia cinnamomea]
MHPHTNDCNMIFIRPPMPHYHFAVLTLGPAHTVNDRMGVVQGITSTFANIRQFSVDISGSGRTGDYGLEEVSPSLSAVAVIGRARDEQPSYCARLDWSFNTVQDRRSDL